MKLLTFRTYLFSGLLFITSVITLFLFIPAHLLMRSQSRRRQVYLIWFRYFCWLYRMTLSVKVVWRGAIPDPSQQYLIVSNHQTILEPVEITLHFPNVVAVMKEELTRVPLWGWHAKDFGIIAIRRERRIESMRTLLRLAKIARDQQKNLLIFPEGTRIDPGVPVAFRGGLPFMYKNLGLPILPVVTNTGIFMSPRAKALGRGTIVYEVLEPIPPGGDPAAVCAELEAAMTTCKARLEAEGLATRR